LPDNIVPGQQVKKLARQYWPGKACWSPL